MAPLWRTLATSVLGRNSGFLGVRYYRARTSLFTEKLIPVFIFRNKGIDIQGYRFGEFLFTNVTGFSTLLSRILNPEERGDTLISQWGDMEPGDELEEAEYDFRHTPRIVENDESRFDETEYFTRFLRLSNIREARGLGPLKEGTTPSTYDE